ELRKNISPFSPLPVDLTSISRVTFSFTFFAASAGAIGLASLSSAAPNPGATSKARIKVQFRMSSPLVWYRIQNGVRGRSRQAHPGHRQPHLPLTRLANKDQLFFIAIGFEIVNRGVIPLDGHLLDLALRQFVVLTLKPFRLEKARPREPGQL